jgi:hypothetical protein
VELGLSLAARRAPAVDRAAAWRLAIGGVVAASAIVRTWGAWQRVTPNYFPDEGIYAALSRSLAHGHLPAVRGHLAHFPALLQPLLTAPAWWFGSLETGYRITQAIGAVAVSTTALAVWWTARRLGVANAGAFAASVLAVAVPDAGYAGWILAEPFAYPLFVAAIGTGTVALARPARRTQAIFLGFALLASLARMQLAVLLLAYLASALLLRRIRGQLLVVGGVAAAGVAALAGGLGYYRHAPAAFHLVGLGSLGQNALVLAFAAGWVVVPAGILGLAAAVSRPRSDEEHAFGLLATTSAVGVIAEATLYGDGTVAHERYACYVLPLLALGFVLHASRGWPWPRRHAVLAVGLLTFATATPMSGWAAAGGNAHSLVLTGLLKVEALAGSAGAGSVWVLRTAAVLTAVVLVTAWRRATLVTAALAVVFGVATSVLATSFDAQNSRNVRAAFLPAGAEWIEGPATVVAGPGAPRTSVLEQFFWNTGARQLALLPNAGRPDVFSTTTTRIAADGRLLGLGGRVVLDEDDGALVPLRPERANGPWLSAASPQLAAVLGGRYGDGWLAPTGSVRLYGPGRLTFTVAAPEPMTLRLGRQAIRLRARIPTHVVACSSEGYAFSRQGYVGLRAVSARATFPVWAPGRC